MPPALRTSQPWPPCAQPPWPLLEFFKRRAPHGERAPSLLDPTCPWCASSTFHGQPPSIPPEPLHAASRYSSSPWSPCSCSRVPCVSKPWSFSPAHARPKAAGAVETSTLLHFPLLSFCRSDAFAYSSFNVEVPRW
jgi:hypothetical protein